MKRLFTFILLLPLLGFSQSTKKEWSFSPGVQDSIFGTSIVLKNSSVIFQKVYESSLSKEELIEKVKLFLPSVKSFQLTNSSNQGIDQFSGRLTDFVVNYRKYGGSLMGTSTLLNYPLNANVIIQIKDKKYRVIVSDILFKDVRSLLTNNTMDLILDDTATRKKRSIFNGNSSIVKALKYIDQDFSDSFNVHASQKITDDF